jgi:hypothetical protein
MGAKDYLVKPVRFHQCKALTFVMKDTTAHSERIDKGLSKYDKIRYLGRGAAGDVNLVRN